MNIRDEIISTARQMGIDKIGFTTRERLSDAPLSADFGYVLPEARSAVSLVVALEKPPIRAYLAKKDQMAHVEDHKRSYIKLGKAGKAIADMLEKKGYAAVSPIPNIEYRQNEPYMAMLPPISHRYVAVASGIGWLGWSGNLIAPEYGAALSLTSVITTAVLEPDPMVEGDYCKDCRRCAVSCPSQFISAKETDKVTIGGRTYTHNKKGSNLRCVVTCGGANGVRRPDSKWSTWSYGVLDLPGPGNEEAFERKAKEYAEDPQKRLLRAIVYNLESRSFSTWEDFSRFWEKTVLVTCANCMLICWPNPEDRKENLRLLTHSGRVVRGEDGKPVVVARSEPIKSTA
jgi:Pyruvate/2-oxoacid:ferredoxin oxidoreductase delta subunit